jgi:SNF family Na+-dependent transporter
MSIEKEKWGSRLGLILAMAGNAVGLGNFLRFPVQAVQNGGGAFIIPYLICFLLMGIPLLWIEWAMGRHGGRKGNHSTPFIFDSLGKRALWKYIGVFGIFTNVAVACYYCYIESWTLSYMYHSVVGTFAELSQSESAYFFLKYIDAGQSSTGIPYEGVVFFLLCLGLNTYILSTGLSGIEKVAKIGVPMLIFFGLILAVRGLTLGTEGASAAVPDANAWDGINFLWTPQFDSLANPKVWLAAAGQIFFTLSLGMGTIHCYASYVESKGDIALNATTSGFTNEFVEVVLGSMIVIPIAAGYLGIDWVIDNAGFGMAFQTMPYLFQQWGPIVAKFAGFFWFGLLFFAGITSSLAMGTPWIGFLKDEFKVPQKKAALSFGLIVLIFGLPTVLGYVVDYDSQGKIVFLTQPIFDEYDYWAGTVGLVFFALAETILFSWIFGIHKGWEEINLGSDMKIPIIFKYIIRYVTPVMLLAVFIGALITPPSSSVLHIHAKNKDHALYLSTVLLDQGFQDVKQHGNRLSGKLPKTEFKQRFPSIGALRTWAGTYAPELKKEEYRVEESQNWSLEFSNLFSGKGWNLDNNSLLKKGVNASEKAEITALELKLSNLSSLGLTLEAEQVEHEIALRREHLLLLNIGRTLLIILFAGISFLVYLAYLKRKKNPA